MQLDTHLLQHGGEYHIILILAQNSNAPESQTLLNFKVIVRDELYAHFFGGLMVGFVGAVIGALLTIFLYPARNN